MTEVLFYHLERRPLEQVLPQLLEKTLERGWRAVVQTGSEERAQSLSQALWTYRDEAFLPHGSAQDGNEALQPIYLTSDENNPNEAQIRFFVDGASVDDVSSYERAVYMFDGNDQDAVAAARERWKAVKAQGHDITYWQQSPEGRWEKKA
ncbi:MAG: DNA polymerase III subunit chi [Pseudomonadota bacterium]